MTPEEIARVHAMLAMDPQEQSRKAAAAMKDALELSSQAGLAQAQESATWEAEANKIPCPVRGRFESLQRQIEKVPLVGTTLATPVRAGVENVEKAFADAATQIGKDPAVARAYAEAVEAVEVEQAVEPQQATDSGWKRGARGGGPRGALSFRRWQLRFHLGRAHGMPPPPKAVVPPFKTRQIFRSGPPCSWPLPAPRNVIAFARILKR